MASPRDSHEAVLSGNKLLVWGGEYSDSKGHTMLSRREIFSFDLTSQQWNKIPAKVTGGEPTPCGLARSVVIDNTAYSFGGFYIKDKKFVCIDEMLSLDCEEIVWKKLDITGDKPTARDSYGVCVVAGKLVIHGGAITDPSKLPLGVLYKQCHSLYGCIDDCWEFSPHEVSWTRLQICGHAPSPRCGHSFTAIPTHPGKIKIVLYGGFDRNWLSDMHVLDCQDGMWTWSEVIQTSVWLARRAWHRTCCVSPSLCLVMGGFVDRIADENAYVVDIAKGTAQLITLDDARALHTACCRVASDGSARIFVFGGTSGDFNLKSCISDLRVYAWDPKAPTTLSICHNSTAQQ